MSAVARPSPVSNLDEARRAAMRADLLARIRANVPERREEVRYGRDILWRQDFDHLTNVLEAKARRELPIIEAEKGEGR